MTKKMYSIFDSKAQVYNPPFFNLTHGEAERNFSQLVSDPKSTLFLYPKDFDLYYLGEYDDNTGKFNPCPPTHMCSAVQHIPRVS